MKLKKIASLILFLSLLGATSAPVAQGSEVDFSTDPRAFWHYANAVYAERTGDGSRALVEFEQAARFDTKSSAIHDRLAYHYYLDGMDGKSEEEVQKSIAIAPDRISTRLFLANLYANKGDLGQARKECLDILKIDPKNFDAEYFLAGVLVSQNRTEDALDEYDKILADNPKAASIYYQMGLLYTKNNDVTKAEGSFKKAIEFDPTLESAYTSLGLVYELDQKPDLAIGAYESLLKVDPDNAPTYLALGELYYNGKQEAKALVEFQNYAQRKPDDTAVYDYIGLCHYRLKQYQASIDDFNKLLEKQPDDPLVRFRLEAVYEEMKDDAGAEAQLQAILKNDGKSVEAWVRLILLDDKKKDKDLVQKTLTEALTKNPGQPDLLLLQSMVYHEADKLDLAEEGYRKVIDLEGGMRDKKTQDYNPDTLGRAYFNLGVILDKQGKFDEAIDQMKKVIQFEPDNADAYNYIGYSYADKNIQLEDAKKYMDNALKLDPDNSYYLDSLAWVYYRKGAYQDAKEQLEKSLKLLKTEVKDDAVIYDHLGEVFLKLGQKDQALAQWQKAMKLDPDNKTYQEKIQKIKPSQSL